jgi:ubiquitin carboxyl-terminal hydrolase 20/33
MAGPIPAVWFDASDSDGSEEDPRASRAAPAAPRGLANLGNTCFLNAALQVLAAAPLLAAWGAACPGAAAHVAAAAAAASPAGAARRASAGVAAAAARALAAVGGAGGHTEGRSEGRSEGHPERPGGRGGAEEAVVPAAVHAALGRAEPHLAGFAQQDAAEALRAVLGHLHDGAADRRGRSAAARACGGRVATTVRCHACSGESAVTEPFYDLAVEVPQSAAAAAGGVAGGWWWDRLASWVAGLLPGGGGGSYDSSLTVESCLDSFFSPEELTGDNQYFCERCKQLCDATRSPAVGWAPELLVVTVKRFYHTDGFGGSYSGKMSAHVAFNDHLDLTPYCAAPAAAAAAVGGGCHYALTGVIVHAGSLRGGHYYAFVRPDPAADVWFCCDDEFVQQVDSRAVAAAQAYCLVYTRERDPSHSLLPEPLAELDLASAPPALSEPAPDRVWVSRQWLHHVRCAASSAAAALVDNSDVVCPHGQLHPQIADDVDAWALAIPSATHALLAAQARSVAAAEDENLCWDAVPVGAGPCARCIDEEISLVARRENERKLVRAAEKRAPDVTPDDSVPATWRWRLLPGPWAKAWQIFVAGEMWEAAPPPGPIDTTALLQTPGSSTVKAGLRAGHDFIVVSAAVWQVLHQIYGGGPEIGRPHVHDPKDRPALPPHHD